MPPAPSVSALPPIERAPVGPVPAVEVFVIPARLRPAISLLVFRFWSLLMSNWTVSPLTGAAALFQLPPAPPTLQLTEVSPLHEAVAALAAAGYASATAIIATVFSALFMRYDPCRCK